MWQDFFSQTASGIISGVVLLIIGAWFFGGRKTTERIITFQGERTSKKLKVFIVISWLMTISGFYVFVVNMPQGGFNNPLTGLGFSLAFFGIILRFIAKFLAWWHRG